MPGGFSEAVEEAKTIEKKNVGYAPYEGSVEVTDTLDLEPKDYMDLNFDSLLNLYERTQKIMSASGLKVYQGQVTGQPITPIMQQTSPVAAQPTAPSAELSLELEKEKIEEDEKQKTLTTATTSKTGKQGKKEKEEKQKSNRQKSYLK